MSIGLCLSGGGVKGAAHIGVLKALEEADIKIDYIAGCSSGSIVASLYAMGYKPMEILYIFKNYCKYITDFDKMIPFKIIGMIFTGKLKLKGLAKGNSLEYIIKEFCLKKNITNINEVDMPLAIPTVDIKTGEIIYFLNRELKNKNNNEDDRFEDYKIYENSGNLADIIRASSSLPCVFEPKYINGRYLIDGGVRMNTPAEILKNMGADKVITVSFDDNKKTNINNFNIVDVTLKSFDIMGHEMEYNQLKKSDYVIMPKLIDVSLLECDKVSYAANIGYMETRKQIEKIKESIM